MLNDDSQETYSFCGTPEYLAPEMLTQEGHDMSVDWWAIGVIIYEMLIGVTPFFNRNKQMLFTKIKSSRVVFPDRNKYKIEYSNELEDIVTQLLHKDKAQRLGSVNDVQDILAHPWFADLDMEALLAKTLKPPFLPQAGDDLTKFFNTETGKSNIADTYIPKSNIK
jgi:serum/glucocorticoid-regulated kinase 2